MSSDGPNRSLMLLAGIGIGAALMYFLDPDRGVRRRNMTVDRAASALRSRRHNVLSAAQHARNHLAGGAAELQSRLLGEVPDDDQLVSRVRAELGHRVRHTGAIEVVVHDGCVILHGPALAGEVADIVRTVSDVHGVERVENRLEVHDTAENVPGLQG